MRAFTVGSSALSFAMALCLSACTPFRQSDPPASLHDFGLRWNHDKQGHAPWSKVVVEAPEWLQDERIRYRLLYNEPTRVRFYTRDRWLAPPPSLLTQRLTAASSGQGYRLRVQLLEFEQVFDSSDHSRVILGLRATAHQRDTDQLTEERLFQLARPAPAPNAVGAVTASAALIDEAVKSLETWLGQLTARPETSRRDW